MTTYYMGISQRLEDQPLYCQYMVSMDDSNVNCVVLANFYNADNEKKVLHGYLRYVIPHTMAIKKLVKEAAFLTDFKDRIANFFIETKYLTFGLTQSQINAVNMEAYYKSKNEREAKIIADKKVRKNALNAIMPYLDRLYAFDVSDNKIYEHAIGDCYISYYTNLTWREAIDSLINKKDDYISCITIQPANIDIFNYEAFKEEYIPVINGQTPFIFN